MSRWALLACALACRVDSGERSPSSPTLAAPAPAPVAVPRDAAPTVAGEQWLVGVLSQDGVPHCPPGEPHEQQWVDVVPVIGWTPTTALGAAHEAWLDRPVVARGRISAWSRPPASPTAPCPIMQQRSDMVFTPRGVRLRRGTGPRPGRFEHTEIRPLTELVVKREGDLLGVEFRNPVPVALRDVSLHMHYEGCHGKPGTDERSHVVGELAVGAGTRTSFPALVDGARGTRGGTSPHRAHSIEVRATGEGVDFALDASVSGLGAPIECPR